MKYEPDVLGLILLFCPSACWALRNTLTGLVSCFLVSLKAAPSWVSVARIWCVRQLTGDESVLAPPARLTEVLLQRLQCGRIVEQASFIASLCN